MKDNNFLNVQVTADIESDYSVRITAETSDYYFSNHVVTEPGTDYLKLLDVLKKLKSSPKMVTIDLISGNTDHTNRDIIKSFRMIDNYGSPKIAELINGHYNFDDEEEAALSFTGFIEHYGKDMNNKAMFEYVNGLIES